MSGTSVISSITAEKIIAVLLRQGAESNALVASLQSDISGEEYKQARHLIGTIMGELYLQGLHPLFVAHPELKPNGLR